MAISSEPSIGFAASNFVHNTNRDGFAASVPEMKWVEGIYRNKRPSSRRIREAATADVVQIAARSSRLLPEQGRLRIGQCRRLCRLHGVTQACRLSPPGDGRSSLFSLRSAAFASHLNHRGFRRKQLR